MIKHPSKNLVCLFPPAQLFNGATPGHVRDFFLLLEGISFLATELFPTKKLRAVLLQKHGIKYYLHTLRRKSNIKNWAPLTKKESL